MLATASTVAEPVVSVNHHTSANCTRPLTSSDTSVGTHSPCEERYWPLAGPAKRLAAVWRGCDWKESCVLCRVGGERVQPPV